MLEGCTIAGQAQQQTAVQSFKSDFCVPNICSGICWYGADSECGAKFTQVLSYHKKPADVILTTGNSIFAAKDRVTLPSLGTDICQGGYKTGEERKLEPVFPLAPTVR